MHFYHVEAISQRKKRGNAEMVPKIENTAPGSFPKIRMRQLIVHSLVTDTIISPFRLRLPVSNQTLQSDSPTEESASMTGCDRTLPLVAFLDCKASIRVREYSDIGTTNIHVRNEVLWTIIAQISTGTMARTHIASTMNMCFGWTVVVLTC